MAQHDLSHPVHPLFGQPWHRADLARWTPNRADLAVVAASWVLVVSALRIATSVITDERGGWYFVMYAIVGATILGLGIPLGWMTFVRHRPLADLGLGMDNWRVILPAQIALAVALYLAAYRDIDLPARDAFLPLVALALAIGFFEAVFWRGWVLLRLEESFGLVPAIVVGSALYALYHIGYGMDAGEMVFLFFIGIMFAVAFRIAGSILILWPFFQPVGQLATLIRDDLDLPLIATVGFGEVLVAMLALVWLAARYLRRHPQ